MAKIKWKFKLYNWQPYLKENIEILFLMYKKNSMETSLKSLEMHNSYIKM